MSELYKTRYCNGDNHPHDSFARGAISGYVVYRDNGKKCPDKDLIAQIHKVAVFVDEEEALDYCRYRNKWIDLTGTDALEDIKDD